MGYSCLKVTQPTQVFNVFGEYVPPAERTGDTVVYRGCYVLDILKVGKVFNHQNYFITKVGQDNVSGRVLHC